MIPRVRSLGRRPRPWHRRAPVPQKVEIRSSPILEGVLTSGTGAGKGLADRVAAGKTGTTDNQAAAWFVGFTPQLAMAVGMGDPKHPSDAMGCVAGYCGGVFGGTFPAQIWHGTEDRNVPVAHARVIAVACPAARLHIVEGGGHMLLSQLDQIIEGLAPHQE